MKDEKEERRRKKRYPTENEPICLIFVKGRVLYTKLLDYSEKGIRVRSTNEMKSKKIVFYTNFKNITFSGQEAKIVWKKKINKNTYEYGLEIVT